MSERRRGRPAVEPVRLWCRTEGCSNYKDFPPSSAAQRSTGTIVCEECRGKGVGLKPRRHEQPPCEWCGLPIEWKRGRSRRFHEDCNLERHQATVETLCGWCGLAIVDHKSRDRKYHSEVAPEPECGWPDGIRLTCQDMGRYKNPAMPLRFVNGKLVRYHDDGMHLLAWNGKAWTMEHRMVAEPIACRCGHMDLFHVDGRCTFDLWGETLPLGKLDRLKSCDCTTWESFGPLPTKTVVHHGPGGPADNSPENLALLSYSDHTALHNALVLAKLARLETIENEALSRNPADDELQAALAEIKSLKQLLAHHISEKGIDPDE